MQHLGIIPARYGSTRFPGKPLVMIRGKSMIMRTWEQARKALDNVVVATDDERILNCGSIRRTCHDDLGVP
jgi:3-deoxy-manno-octulosonate cytidylyltransferase (CMP-KDO synthetase)